MYVVATVQLAVSCCIVAVTDFVVSFVLFCHVVLCVRKYHVIRVAVAELCEL